MEVISSRISGWRVTDSITLPKMMPMPTPAPTAPRPPPTPRAIALPASEPSSAAAKTKAKSVLRILTGWTLLVGLGDRAADVDRGQSGEDERLQGGHQADLEQVEHDAQRQQEHADSRDAEDDGQTAGHEQDDQVPGEHVGEQTHGERDDPHDVRQQLEDEDEAGHGAGHPRGDEALEVAANTLRADALGRVGDEDYERQDERNGHVCRRRVDAERRDLQPEHRELLVRGRQRDEADQVAEPDEQEQRPDEREVLRRHA